MLSREPYKPWSSLTVQLGHHKFELYSGQRQCNSLYATRCLCCSYLIDMRTYRHTFIRCQIENNLSNIFGVLQFDIEKFERPFVTVAVADAAIIYINRLFNEQLFDL